MNDDKAVDDALDKDGLPVHSPQEIDEEGFDGLMPNPEAVEGEDTLDRAHDMGLYPDDDDDGHPSEINGLAQVERAEKNED